MITAQELIEYFETAQLPGDPVRLNQCTVISDPKKFVASHLANLKNEQMPERMRKSFAERLLTYKNIISQ
jgi:hypothetical protein